MLRWGHCSQSQTIAGESVEKYPKSIPIQKQRFCPLLGNGCKYLICLGISGGPGRSPTCDLRVRSALLYATELPGLSFSVLEA